MRKLLIICFFVTAKFLFAQQIEEKSLLWEISGNGIEMPSFLFGTIHIACEGDVIINDEIRNSFDKTTELMLEIDLSDPQALMQMMIASNATDGIALSDKLGEELSVKVDSFLQENKSVSLSMFDNLNVQSFLVQMSLMGMDCPMGVGYDLLFLQEAVRNEMPIKGLESIQTQIDLFMNQPEEESFKAIEYFVDNFSEMKAQTSSLIEMYKVQDIQGLYEVTVSGYKDSEYSFGGNVEDLLDNRNMNWIPVIENQIKEIPTFIAFGAAHLAGEKGVIHLLRERGYTLTPVYE